MSNPFKTPSLRWLAAPLLLLLAVPAQADDSIKLADGTKLDGQATAYDPTNRVLSFATADGKELSLSLEELDQRTAFRVLRSQVPRDSGTGQLQLANFTRDINLFAHAVRIYGYAEQADPSLEDKVAQEMEVLKSRAATWAMGLARDAIAAGDIHEAEKWLTAIVTKVPNQPEAAQAQAMLDEYYNKVHAQRTEKADAEHADLLQKDLKGAKQAYDRMLERNKTALKDSKGGNRAISSWEGAISDGQRALREIDTFEKRNADGGYGELLGEYRGAVSTQMIEIYMNLASHYSTRSSYNKALVQVNNALALDPGNRDALAMRNRIQDAASRGIGWNW